MESEKFTTFASKFNLSQHSLPILMVEQINHSDSGDSVFKTIPSSREALLISSQGRALGSKPLENAVVFAFHSFERSINTGISVGRTNTNKISLPDNAVSKMHASFKRNPQQEWQIVDVESENGTRINGQPIPANKPYILKNGDGITFGDTYHCTFFLPEGFKAYIDSLK